MYYVITKNQQLFAICFSNAYDLGLDSSVYSIHELDLPCPDVNNVEWSDELGEWMAKPGKITKLSFLNRFTMSERIAIRSSTDPIVEDIMKLFDAAEYISIDHINTIQGIGYLNSVGILTTERVVEILT